MTFLPLWIWGPHHAHAAQIGVAIHHIHHAILLLVCVIINSLLTLNGRLLSVGIVAKRATLSVSVIKRSAISENLLFLAHLHVFGAAPPLVDLLHVLGAAPPLVDVTTSAHLLLATLRGETKANVYTTQSPRIQRNIPLTLLVVPLLKSVQKTEEGVLTKLHTL